jgi:hypothetical protein
MTTLYPYQVQFERKFVKGNLKGITISDSLSFATKEAAERWVENTKSKVVSNSLILRPYIHKV